MQDDHNNRTLESSQLFDSPEFEGHDVKYIRISCVGKEQAAGRRAYGVVVKSMDQNVQLQLSAVTECSNLHNNRVEIPTREMVENYCHLLDIAQYIPLLDDSAHFMLLI